VLLRVRRAVRAARDVHRRINIHRVDPPHRKVTVVMVRRPRLGLLLAFLVLELPGSGRRLFVDGQDGGAAQQAQAQDAMGQSGIAMTQGFDFGNSALDASKGRNMATTSRVNQNFLRRGTRSDLERIYIERLLGRRGPEDWLLAGSEAWTARRAKLDREAAELRERIAIGDACTRDFNIEECESVLLACVLSCGLMMP
jgi:hypothetical protein